MDIALSAAAIALFAAAAFTDITRRRIPNRLVTALAAVGLLRILAALVLGAGEAAPGLDLGIAFAVFAAGAALFHFSLLGGGDVKLLAAGALWIGGAAVGEFLVLTALAGGALAVLFVLGRFLIGGGRNRMPASLPYGVAIAAGGILTTAAAI